MNCIQPSAPAEETFRLVPKVVSILSTVVCFGPCFLFLFCFAKRPPLPPLVCLPVVPPEPPVDDVEELPLLAPVVLPPLLPPPLEPLPPPPPPRPGSWGFGTGLVGRGTGFVGSGTVGTVTVSPPTLRELAVPAPATARVIPKAMTTRTRFAIPWPVRFGENPPPFPRRGIPSILRLKPENWPSSGA